MATRYDTGTDRWTHGTRRDGHDDYHVWLGPCPHCGSRTFDYGGWWACVGFHNPYCIATVGNIVCNAGPNPSWWDTDFQVTQDPDDVEHGWFASAPTNGGKVVGYGSTPALAVKDLRQHMEDGERS
jgi:hypothetical protein